MFIFKSILYLLDCIKYFIKNNFKYLTPKMDCYFCGYRKLKRLFILNVKRCKTIEINNHFIYLNLKCRTV